MRHYDLHEAARQDILSLVEYVSGNRADAERARDALTDALVECFERLSDFPELGRARPEFGSRIRSAAIKRLRVTVFYIATPGEHDHVRIVRVLRQGRDVAPTDFE